MKSVPLALVYIAAAKAAGPLQSNDPIAQPRGERDRVATTGGYTDGDSHD